MGPGYIICELCECPQIGLAQFLKVGWSDGGLSLTSLNSYTLSCEAMPATTAETLSLVTRNVSVAPLVLLSAADHYGRSGKGLRKRVVGVLLGQNDGKNVRVSNSFAGETIVRAPLPFVLLTPFTSTV